MQTNFWEMFAMILYLVLVVGVGVYFFAKSKNNDNGEKEYFLGGRNMGGWVAALSAGASDMSAWVLMSSGVYLSVGYRSGVDFGRAFDRNGYRVDIHCAAAAQIFDSRK